MSDFKLFRISSTGVSELQGATLPPRTLPPDFSFERNLDAAPRRALPCLRTPHHQWQDLTR